jgi:hypothetical protein
MPKKGSRRNRSRRGGFSFTNWITGSQSQNPNPVVNNQDLYNRDVNNPDVNNKTKSSSWSSWYNSWGNKGDNQNQGNYRYGGRKGRKTKRGGFKSNSPASGLATNAAPFSGKTASYSLVGGRRLRKRKTMKRSRKH